MNRVLFASPFALAAVVLALGASRAVAAPMALIDPALGGPTQYDEWSTGNLTIAQNPGFPGFPGSAAWPSPIGSGTLGSEDAVLNKVANGTGGGPYPASGSIYFGGFSGDINNPGGVLAVSDATPLADVAKIVFQIQIGEAWTYDFVNHELPRLSYNGGSQALAPTGDSLLEQYFNGTVEMPTGPEDVFINTYLLEWDVSALGPISGFSIAFEGVQHAQLYALRLDQYAVPEPATFGLGGLALAGFVGLAHARRRRQAAKR